MYLLKASKELIILVTSICICFFSLNSFAEPQQIPTAQDALSKLSNLSISSKNNTPSSDLPNLESKLFSIYANRNYIGYTASVVVRQPVYKSRDALNQDLDNGHCYIRIEKHGKNPWITYYSFDVLGQDFQMSMTGYLKWFQDGSSKFSVAKTFEIKESDVPILINFAKNYPKNNKFNYEKLNCVNFVIDSLKLIGISEPQLGIKQHPWLIPQWAYALDKELESNIIPSNGLFGYNPADAGQDLIVKGNVLAGGNN